MMGKSESEGCGDGWLGEFDSLPLKERLKLLRFRKQASDSVDSKEAAVRGQCGSVTGNSIVSGGDEGRSSSEEESMSCGEDYRGMTFDCKVLGSPCFPSSNCSLNGLPSPTYTSSGCCVGSRGGICRTSFSNNSSPGSSLAICKLLQHPELSDVPPKAENECHDDALTVCRKGSMRSDAVCVEGARVKSETCCDFDDNLENVALSKRRRMLLSRLTVKSQSPCLQVSPISMAKSHTSPRDGVQEKILLENQDGDGENLENGNLLIGSDDDLFLTSNTSISSKNDVTRTLITTDQSSEPSSDDLHNAKPYEFRSSIFSGGKPYVKQKILRSKDIPASIGVKVEPQLFDELGDGQNVMASFTSSLIPVKKEPETFDGAAEKDSGHLPLIDDFESLPVTCGLGASVDVNYPSKGVPLVVGLNIDQSESVKMLGSKSNEIGPSCLMDCKPNDRQENITNHLEGVSSFITAIHVKTEPVSSNKTETEENKSGGMSLSPSLPPVKIESTHDMEVSDDKLDHMTLFDRILLLSSETSSSSSASKDIKCPSIASANLLGVEVLESIEPISVIRPRKRKRTATDCAETALEEDAPGLLKVLMEKGVSAEEIKLYGEPESNEVIDEAFCEDSFAELEAIIWKVFSYRQPVLKLGSIGCSKGSKVTYCLGCLLSLVEQAHCLRSRKWPVEWGWCRDLQSFIFVFPRHNRIVLERPEYGFATYFFELLDSLPVSWQIRRLVTTMKLTNCGRITLLENRALKVGEDISEWEARVLSRYGWVPNTGLATMLNYCDRVVHDTNKERDGNEWRVKIGRILVNGFNGGSVVPKFLSKKHLEEESTQNPQVKQEI